MSRYNIFNLIHKALRLKLYESAQELLHTYFGDKDEAALVFAKLNKVIDAFEKHGQNEDNILMPLIADYQPDTIASFEQDHKEDHQLGNQLKQLQLVYHSAQNTEERCVAGSAITIAFIDYMIFNLQHMQREEVELNKLLWTHFADDELAGVSDEIGKLIPAEEFAITTQWVMQAINCDEAIKLLQDAKEKAPEAVFNSLFALTDSCLPKRIRAKVQDAVLLQPVELPVY